MSNKDGSLAESQSNVYFCLPVSDHPARSALKQAGRELSSINPDKFHLTLRYIELIDQLALGSLVLAVKQICQRHKPFVLILDRPGDIPNINSYRPVDSQPLRKLQADIDQAVLGLGFPPADYSYNPHITLARQPDKAVHPVEPASWQTSTVELRQSEKKMELNPLLAEFVLGPVNSSF